MPDFENAIARMQFAHRERANRIAAAILLASIVLLAVHGSVYFFTSSQV